MANHSSELNQHSKRDSLRPIGQEGREFGLPSYVTMWISSMVVIQIFILGQSFLPPAGSLNIFQAGLVAVISALIIWVFFGLNSKPGMIYGIPFIVQARSSFGYYGARIASLIRIIPAVFWYGIGSWIGASALEYVTTTIWGWGNVWVYFILFQVFQTLIAYFGIKSIKWFDSLLSVVILAFLFYIVYQLFNVGNVNIQNSWNTAPDWGMPFFAAITAAVGILITASINNGDLARFLENKPRNNWLGHFLGIAPMFVIILAIGVLSAAATGIWDPVQALVSVMPNSTVAVILMIFIILAQFTSNLTINIEPPALVITETFDLKWGVSVIIVGALGIATFPWILLTSQMFNTFIAFYSAFLGPLLGILLADYYILRKQKLNVKFLYERSLDYNWLGIGSLLIGGVFGIIFLQISWIVAMPISMILYVVGYKVLPGYAQRLEKELAEDDELAS